MFGKWAGAEHSRRRVGCVTEELRDLVLYRLEQANESLEAAEILLQQEKSRPSVNRSYYAMFYAILALGAIRESRFSKHSGVIAMFDREFVRSGVFSKEFSRWLHEAFDLRQRADYRAMFSVSPARARATLSHACEFVAALRGYVLQLVGEAGLDDSP